jgi:hypothetical protein
VSGFNAETGGAWTRATLAAAARANAKLRVAYEEYAIRSVAGIARIVGEAFRDVSPRTRLAIQHNPNARRTVAAIVGALYDAGGRPVGYRAGAGAYYDVNPNDQILKAIAMAGGRRDFAHPEKVGLWSYEIACFPRTYGTKSAQSIITEAFSSLMFGFDAASALVLNYGQESEELYLRTRLKPMAEAAAALRALAAAGEGAVPVGFTFPPGGPSLYRFSQLGVPVLFGPGRSCGRLQSADLRHDRCRMSSAEVQRVRTALDARAGGLPALLESPFVGMMLPRVAADGSLRSVALLNLRLDAQGPVHLRLRGVPADVTRVTWHEMRAPALSLPLTRDGAVCTVVLPSIAAWNGGVVVPETRTGNLQRPAAM